MIKAPSTEWTDKERLDVINALSNNLLAAFESRRATSQLIIDLAERILFLTAKPSRILENNRAHVLEGVEFEPPALREIEQPG